MRSFQLIFREAFRLPESAIAVDLASKDLDSALFPSGVARVVIYTKGGEAKKINSGFILDSFHISSIESFLSLQDSIKKQLRLVLEKEQSNLDSKRSDSHVPNSVEWAVIKVLRVTLSLRHIAESKHGKHLSPEEMEFMDRPDTQARFQLWLKVDPEDEHMRMFDFRDGHLLSSSVE